MCSLKLDWASEQQRSVGDLLSAANVNRDSPADTASMIALDVSSP
jgi:hypothetical protein